MNRKKLLSFALCIALLLSCIIFTGEMPTAVGATSGAYENEQPVTPPESDFTYMYYSDDISEGVIITGYSGKETKIIIPETLGGAPVIEINSDVFSGNEKITSIKLPSTLMYLGGDAFNLCSSLTEILVDEENPDFISVDGVLYCKNIIEDSPLFGKPEILLIFPAGKGGSFTVPYGVKTIGAYSFSHCYNLTEVKMYNTVLFIDDYAFSHCWGLQKIRLSDNLRVIRKKALEHCVSLKRIDLPSSLIVIGADAFLGDIDSKDNKVYFFTKGISCTKDTYAHRYLVKQALPESIIILNKRSVTDNDTGIKLIDAYDVLPENQEIDLVVKPVELSAVESLFPTRYSKAFCFDISFTKGGEAYIPEGNLVLNFDSLYSGAIPSATKVYKQEDDNLILVSGAPHTPFVGAQTSQGGRFIILINEDFTLKGDVDGDGIVTLTDVKTVLHASIGTLSLTNEQKTAANVDDSTVDKITTTDARRILRLAGGME